jgi:hypothetical protein
MGSVSLRRTIGLLCGNDLDTQGFDLQSGDRLLPQASRPVLPNAELISNQRVLLCSHLTVAVAADALLSLDRPDPPPNPKPSGSGEGFKEGVTVEVSNDFHAIAMSRPSSLSGQF